MLVRTGDVHVKLEADRLAAIAGPGVPAVLETHEDAGEFRLVRTLATSLPLRSLDTPQLASSFATLADVLARAHDVGIVHGPIEAADVRVDGGQIQLDAWGAGPSGWTTADDVAALGQLLGAFATDEGLRNIAARATTTDALARPAAATLASALLDVGVVVVPRRVAMPPRVAAASAIALGVLVVAILVSGRPGAPERGSEAAAPPPPTVPRGTPATTTLPPPTAADVVIDGNSVVREGIRWSVGRPGDVIVVGEWRCDGVSTPAVLRPANGRVWRFARWADDGRPIAGQLVATVPGATRARVRRSGTCDRLEVLDGSGQSTLVG